MKGYYGDKISPNRTKTPEGFLICHETPIARTGTQEYMRHEIGLDGTGVIKVYRDEAEVFSENAMASFEGKPITDDHPRQEVDTYNYGTYMKGTVQNVRRNGDKLVADLVIHDANLIAEIEAGKREISCGYECRYEVDKAGNYHQTHIIGNHVAVVNQGRAGAAVRIRDEKGDNKMKNKSILQRMFDKFVKDADPDEIKEAAKAVDEAEDKPADEGDEKTDEKIDVKELAKAVDALTKTVDGLSSIVLSQRKNTLDELEEELTQDDDNEEQAAQSEDDETEMPTDETKTTDDDDETNEETTTAKDKAVALAAIRAIKPIVAALPAGQRQKATDAMTKAIRDALKQPLPKQNTYAMMNKRKTADAAAVINNRKAYGDNCSKYNPHTKGAK